MRNKTLTKREVICLAVLESIISNREVSDLMLDASQDEMSDPFDYLTGQAVSLGDSLIKQMEASK